MSTPSEIQAVKKTRALRHALAIFALAILVLLAAVRVDRVRARQEAPLLELRPIAVRVARVERGQAAMTLTVPGVVEAAHGTDLAPEVTARVVDRLVEPGDRIRRGDLLLRLEATQLAADLEGRRAQAAATVAEAEAARHTLEVQEARTRRDRRLYEGGAVSLEALELSQASLARALAAARAAEEAVRRTGEAVAAARDRLADTELRAPWAGEVAAVAADPGDLAVAGKPVLRLVRDGDYRVDCRLPQEAAMGLAPGDPVTIEAGGRELAAAVSRIGGGLDPTGLARVEIDVPKRPLGRSDGASVRVMLRLRSTEGLTVPVLAVLDGGPRPIVYRLDGPEADRVTAVPVEVLLRGTESMVVEGDLEDGDRVVAEHPSTLMLLSDGARVRPVGVEAAEEPSAIMPGGER